MGSGNCGHMTISILNRCFGGLVLSGQTLLDSRPSHGAHEASLGPVCNCYVTCTQILSLFRLFSHLLFSVSHLLLECCPILLSLPGYLRDGSTIEEPGPSGLSRWMTLRRGPLAFGTLYALERQIEHKEGHGTSLLGPVSVSSVRHTAIRVVHRDDFL